MLPRIFGTIAAAILLTAISLVAGPVAAEGIASKGHVSGVNVADGPAFHTGWWVGIAAKTQNTSLGDITVNDTILGAGGGFDYVIPSTGIVAGMLADVSVPYGTLKSDYDTDTSWFVGGRAGVLLSERLLGYGLGGVTHHGIPSAKAGFDLDSLAPTFGAGAELLLTKNLSTGVEWRRVNINGGDEVAPQDSFGAFLRWRF